MVTVKVLGEFYFSQAQGTPIYDAKGLKVGRIHDMVVRWDGVSPVVTGIKYAKGIQHHIDIGQIDQWNEHALKLKGQLGKSALRKLLANEIYIGKWLLDKQIIDLKGSKLVRVNDIKLSWVRHGKNYDIILVAVDIGLRGLFRRLGIEFVLRKQANRFVGSQYIRPLEDITADLQLNQDQESIRQLHPVDIAEIIEELDLEERSDFLHTLDNQTAADALAEVDLDIQVEIIEQMESQRASDILEEMPPDEAADILGELNAQKSDELLGLMQPEEAEDVRELMSYPEETAGSLMTTEYIAFVAGMSAEETINRLRELAPSAETIYYLYVLDAREVLQGVVSLRDLIIASPSSVLQDIMSTRVVSVNHHDDQRKVVDLVSKYNLLALPVVDDAGVMMGIITIDDVLGEMLPDRSNLETFSHFMLAKGPLRRWVK
ncbi:MAG: CBS domain-containing protein [Peptococcaceae bacterium]|nr:CBS domain-containing protein [Peptococcaceae bacterium]